MENSIRITGVKEFLELSSENPIVDVRTPAEFEKGHIPGGHNIPLFSDQERADVGTIYKKRGNIDALLKGLEHVGPNMSALLRSGIEVAGVNRRLLLYCWRGGMRSSSMAWLFSLAGIECVVLKGGYKHFREDVLQTVGAVENIVVLGGLTGSGKTDILKEIAQMGEQVVDLEDLANHRGSAFGAIGMPPQPTSEQFANLLFMDIIRLDRERRIFIEDESLNIGSVFMPEEFYKQIRKSRVIAIMTDIKTRIPRLMEEYGKMETELLENSIRRIRKRLGYQNADEALEAIENGNMTRAIEIVLGYYDKTYRYGLERRNSSLVSTLNIDNRDDNQTARLVIEMADRYGL